MANPYLNLIQTVWENGKPWRHLIIGYYLAYILAQGILSLSPFAFGKTIDVLQNFNANRMSDVIFWLIFGVSLLPIFWIFHGPSRVVERRVALKIQQSFLMDIYNKLTQLPLKWHQDHHSGNIITRLNRASESLNRFAGDQYIYIETLIKLLVSMVFLFWISFPIGLLNLISCSLGAFMVLFFDRKLIPLYQSENEVENHVGAGLFDYISNITTVLTLRLTELTQTNLFQRLSAIWPFFKKEAVLNEVKWFTMNMILSVTQSLILIGYILYHLHSTNTILIGTVVMIFRYQWSLSEVFYSLSMHYSELVRMHTDVQGVKPILDDIQAHSHAIPGAQLARQWHTITIHDLQFSHQNNDSGLIPVHLTIKRGEKIALIGSSGAGKSTLLNLLSGLYTPRSVRLNIDGTEFHSLEPLHAITTLIPQEPEIFENTIAFNITMALEAEPKIIQDVVQLSGFSSVLEKLPSGLATDIREKGLNLSVGQKQRLALARGLFAARFSSLILMDEPTSSVDLATEKKILSGVIQNYSEATMIVSLHRLHLLPQFTRIILLEQGVVIADGPTQELLSNPGVVKDLWEKYQAKLH